MSDLSDDKRDFELLARRLSSSNSSSSSSSSTTPTNSGPQHQSSHGPENDEIYPLQLTTNFVDHYVIGDVIGSGSYAEVRECIHTETLERCALKVINQDYLSRQAPRALANQMQEIRLLRYLHHPNVIAMREVISKGNKIYISLEYCPFVLSDILEELPSKRLSVPMARDLFHQLCCGLNYLHSLGIVHRDIKPQNLLVTNSGILKIIDFGVSHILSMWNTKDDCSNYEGSPLFQAPEVVCGQPRYAGFKVDVWSTGVTLYLMLYGDYPFADESLLGLYDKILAQDIEIPSGPPSELVLSDLLRIMLEKVSDRRATIGEILAHPWLKLDSNHHYDNDDEHLEFIDLVLAKQTASSSNSGSRATPSDGSGCKSKADIYRSISVLPYLYRHHFPHLPVMKARRSPRPGAGPRSASSSRSSSGSPSPASLDSSPAVSSSSWSSSAPGSSPSSGASEASNPNCILDHPDEVEWGTREQYQLMKVPPVRANRITDSRQRQLERSRTRGQRRRRRQQRKYRHPNQAEP